MFNQAGIHHADLPMSESTAGVMIMRTKNASTTTPTARPKAMDAPTAMGLDAKPQNTTVMMAAAATRTGALLSKPRRIASLEEKPLWCISCIRDTRKTW